MSVSRSHLVLGSAFTLVALGATAHAGVVINPEGAGLRIEVEADGQMQIRRGDLVQLAGEGIVASIGDKQVTWSPGSQSAITGAGTDDEPYRLDTVLLGGEAKLLIRLAYVTGAEELDVAMQVWSYTDEQFRLYHLIDSQPNYPAQSYWTGDAGSPDALGLDAGATSVELATTTTAFARFHAGEAGMPALLAAAGADLGNELDSGRDLDRSLGAQWSFGEVWPLISYQLRFSGAVCGDGVLATAEICDDGNNVSGDQCTSSCTVPRQGDLDDDQVEDSLDVCPGIPDAQTDVDQDGLGDACDPTDDRPVNDIGPSDGEPDDGWGSDDVGPPPTGPGPREIDDVDPSTTSDGDEPGYGSATDDDSVGCSAGGGGAGGGMLVLFGLAAMVRRRKR